MADPTDRRNEDWLRALSWDLPSSLNGYLAAVAPNPGESLADAVRRHLELPSSEQMPAELRQAVDGWLADNDPHQQRDRRDGPPPA